MYGGQHASDSRWTPAHFPRDTHGLAQFDGTHLYEHSRPGARAAHSDWGTLVLLTARQRSQNYLNLPTPSSGSTNTTSTAFRVDAGRFHMLYLDYSRKTQ